uniref:Fungal-type protein kinase domain-containing protein n=1 Tax=Psilocybe cubensis TaxID=181762 RepID=A0A8H7YBN7_PSICU
MSTSNGDCSNAMPATSSDHDSVIAATPASFADASTICKTPDAGSAEEPSTHNGSVASTSAEGATASETNANGTLATTADTNSNNPPADANSNKPRPSETPRANRTDGKTEKLTSLRSQIALEMNNEFVECSVEVFLKHYLPFEPSEVAVEECILRLLGKDPAPTNDAIEGCPSVQQAAEPLRRSARLKTLHKPVYNEEEPILSEIILEETTASLRFTDYMERPSKQEAVEKTLFAPLKSIADAVGGYSETCDGRTRNSFQYLNCQDTIISSDIRGSNNKIDACFSNGGSDLHTKYIVVPIEQKISGANRDSMTFEGDEATLWYHCRSHSAISKQFSFVENPKLLVKVFLSFLFATDEELGYNPDVTLVEGKKRQYTFKIPSSDGKSAKFYRTVKVLSEYRSNNISGRMARVWLVDQVDSEGNKIGPQCILKDVWLAVNALTEKEIQTAIFADIEKYCHPDKPDYNLASDPPEDSPQAALNAIKMRNAELVKSGEYKQYFLEIESDHAGKPSKDVLEGCTPVTGLFQNADANRIASLNENSIRPVGSTGLSKTRQPSIRTYTPRKQYRVIFKEVCQPVGDLPTLGKVLDVIQQTLIPLSLLYCAGWVHRDISSGNILAHEVGSVLRAKLSDLEYAKKFPLPEDHEGNVDPKTGTPFFMPVEIMRNSYLHTKARNHNKVISLVGNLKEAILRHHTQDNQTTNGKPTATPVVYNFQHDLESLWWVLVWSLTARVDHQPSRMWANDIFQHDDVLTSARLNFLRPYRGDPDEHVEDLQRIMLPSISVLSYLVDALRDAMDIDYSKRESGNMLRDPLSYAIIVNLFHFAFQTLQNSLDYLKSIPLLPSAPVDGPNSVQPVDVTTAPGAPSVSVAPSLIPSRKRPNPNTGQTAPSESFQPGPVDEDVEATLERQRSKRIKTQDDPNAGGGSNAGGNAAPGNSTTGRRSKSGTRSKTGRS